MRPSDQDLAFIADLQELAARGQHRTLAHLPGVVKGHSRASLQGLRLLGAWGQGQWETELRPRLIVAGLFSLHPQNSRRGNIGYTLRRVQKAMQYGEALEKRFMALLNCHADDLENHLRRAVSLAHSADQPINWARLLGDIRGWDHPDRLVQQSWADSFWRSRALLHARSDQAVDEPQNDTETQRAGGVSSDAR